MPRPNLSLPHERRKAQLKSQQLKLKVRIAEAKQHLGAVSTELKAMTPKKPNSGA